MHERRGRRLSYELSISHEVSISAPRAARAYRLTRHHHGCTRYGMAVPTAALPARVHLRSLTLVGMLSPLPGARAGRGRQPRVYLRAHLAEQPRHLVGHALVGLAVAVHPEAHVRQRALATQPTERRAHALALLPTLHAKEL